nr:hypothetical protein [uncultured Caproiciproducens sp.]
MLGDILVMPLVFLLAFFLLRWLYVSIIHYQLNSSAKKKRKKDQTFKEWLLYSRYRNEIPQFLIYFYFIFIILNFVIFILAILFYTLNNADFVHLAFITMVCIDYGITFILDTCFYGRRKNGQTYYKVERWVKKRKKK